MHRQVYEQAFSVHRWDEHGIRAPSALKTPYEYNGNVAYTAHHPVHHPAYLLAKMSCVFDHDRYSHHRNTPQYTRAHRCHHISKHVDDVTVTVRHVQYPLYQEFQLLCGSQECHHS